MTGGSKYAVARCKILTNIMPKLVKVSVEPGIRELFRFSYKKFQYYYTRSGPKRTAKMAVMLKIKRREKQVDLIKKKLHRGRKTYI